MLKHRVTSLICSLATFFPFILAPVDTSSPFGWWRPIITTPFLLIPFPSQTTFKNLSPWPLISLNYVLIKQLLGTYFLSLQEFGCHSSRASATVTGLQSSSHATLIILLPSQHTSSILVPSHHFSLSLSAISGSGTYETVIFPLSLFSLTDL